MTSRSKEIEDNIRKRFIDVIKQLNQQDSSLNIEKIMKSVGDYQQAYTQMNTGKRYPTLKNIVLLCQCYGISANWLLFGIGNNGLETAQDPLKRITSMEQEIEMLKLILIKKRRKT